MSDNEFTEESEVQEDLSQDSNYEDEKSEFEDEFEDDLEEGIDVSVNKLEKLDTKILPQEPIEEKELAEKIAEIKIKVKTKIEELKPVIQKYLFLKIKIGKKKYRLLDLLKTILILIVCIFLLNVAKNYMNFIRENFDDSFLLNSNYLEDIQEDFLSSTELSLLDDDDLSDLGYIFEIKNILFNIRFRDKKDKGLLKISLGMELSDEFMVEDFRNRRNQIKHLIILNLSNLYYDEIGTIQKRKELRNLIKDKINGMLTSGSVKRVFFTEFVYN